MKAYDRREIEQSKRRMFPEPVPEPEPDYHYAVLAIVFALLVVIGAILY